MGYTTKGICFWNMFKAFAELIYVKRGGLPRFKNFENYDTSNPFFDERPQSDLEHCANGAFLVMLLKIFYGEELELDDSEYSNVNFAVLTHELGEALHGDIPDDGTRDNQKVDKEEQDYTVDLLWKNLPADIRVKYIAIRVGFDERQDHCGQVSICVDKLEAILFNLFDEYSTLNSGKIPEYHKKNMTEKDLESIKITGSNHPADMWFCGFIASPARNYPFFGTIVEIIQSAAYAVRGEIMGWVDDYLATFNN